MRFIVVVVYLGSSRFRPHPVGGGSLCGSSAAWRDKKRYTPSNKCTVCTVIASEVLLQCGAFPVVLLVHTL